MGKEEDNFSFSGNWKIVTREQRDGMSIFLATNTNRQDKIVSKLCWRLYNSEVTSNVKNLIDKKTSITYRTHWYIYEELFLYVSVGIFL